MCLVWRLCRLEISSYLPFLLIYLSRFAFLSDTHQKMVVGSMAGIGIGVSGLFYVDTLSFYLILERLPFHDNEIQF